MSYNKKLSQFNMVKEKSLEEGMDAILLHKNTYNNNYCELEELTGFIEKIEPSEKRNNMWELTLLFNHGERATTQVYIDDPNIKEKTIVSIIGYVTRYNGEYQLYCRGITPIYTSLEELAEADPDLNKFVKVSLCINLSDIKETRTFKQSDAIQKLGNSGYYYTVTKSIMKMNNQEKMDMINNMLKNQHSKETENEEKETEDKETNIGEQTSNSSAIDEIKKDFPMLSELGETPVIGKNI